MSYLVKLKNAFFRRSWSHALTTRPYSTTTDNAQVFEKTESTSVSKCSKLILQEQLELEASKVVIDSGNVNLDVAEGVGMVERRQMFDGKKINTVLPANVYHKKPLVLPNLNYSDEIPKDALTKYKSKSKLYHMYCTGLPGVTAECLHSSNYYFEDGLRKVMPYYFVLDNLVPRLTQPMTVYEYVSKLLSRRNSDWLKFRIEKGFIQVNFERKRPDDHIREGDYFTSLNHYHEDPVLDEPIDIIFENNEILIVNKPPSYLIYPASSSRYNSLIFVLAKENGYLDLRPVHRLDKNTSGVCILAKGPTVSRRLQNEFKSSESCHRKEYLAMVDGAFPETEVTVESPLSYFSVTSAMQRKYLEPKKSVTSFKRIGYDGRTSLVICSPRTGRTHQIRLHLEKLGHPIVNDYLYNPPDKLLRYEIDRHRVQSAVHRIRARSEDMESETSRKSQQIYAKISPTVNSFKKDEYCLMCELGPEFEREKALNEQMFMCLHSWKYTIGGMTFEAPLPRWATDSGFLDQVFEKRKKLTPKMESTNEL